MGNIEEYPGNSVQNDRVENRVREIRQFLRQNNSISKACVLCLLEKTEKVEIYPDHLELVQTGEKSIIAVKISNMLY